MERTFNADRRIFIPNELQLLKNWVCWAYEARGNNKKTKIPYDPKAPDKKASSTNPETWGTIDEAIKAYEQNENLAGIGFVFTSGDPYCGIDLDDALNGDRAPKPKCADLLAKIGETYTEITPSGCGLHIIGKATIGQGRKTDSWEAYCEGRYFTFTGDILNPNLCEIRDIQNGIRDLLAPKANGGDSVSVDPNDWQKIQIEFDPAREPKASVYSNLRESDKNIRQTIDRTRKDMKDSSPSAYDMSLASMLVMSGWEDQEIADMLIFVRKQHGDDLKRADYYQRTIYKAKTTKDISRAIGDVQTIDADDRDGALKNIRIISRLPIAKIIQRGEREAFWSLVMDDGKVYDIGGTDQVWNRREWINIALESGAQMPQITNKQWPGFIRAIQACKVVIDNPELTTPGQVEALLHSYIAGRMDSIPDEAVDKELVDLAFSKYKPFIMHGDFYFSASSFHKWASLTTGLRKNPGQMASALSVLGWKNEKLTRRVNGKPVGRWFYHPMASKGGFQTQASDLSEKIKESIERGVGITDVVQ